MFSLFSKYLLIGFSAMVLLFGVQKGLFNRQSTNFVLAEDACREEAQDLGNGCAQNYFVCDNGSRTKNGSVYNISTGGSCDTPVSVQTCQYSEAPQNCPDGGTRVCTGTMQGGTCKYDPGVNPNCAESCQPVVSARNDQCNPVGSPQGDCSVSGNTGHKYCQWQPNGNVISSCVIEACQYGGTPPNNCSPAPSCTSNGSCSAPIPACGTITSGVDNCNNPCSKQGPACVPGCTSNGSCSVQVPAACGQTNVGVDNCNNVCVRQSVPCSGAQGSPADTGTCYVCDNGNWRPGGNNPMTIVQCSRVSNSLFDQPEKPIWCQVPQQPPASCVSNLKICSAPAPSCGSVTQGVDNCGRICVSTGAACPVTQGGNITVNPTITNTNTNTNTNTVTVNNPAPVTFGNVGVGTTVYTQAVQYTQLPKTGLPALAWSALAFLPAGLKMRRFSRVKKDLENHPSFIWEERQYRSGS